MRDKQPKKVKGGLVPDKDLNVVTSAGFKAEKRVRSTNRRAGLHDKKKDLDGEKRVYRRKPLALKHKRRMRKAAAALSAVFVGCVAFVGYGFIFKKPVAPLGDGGYETICLELPSDGAKPTSHTAVECVGYMNYALKHQESWSSEFHATVNAMGLMSQSVSTYKEYSDSVLVSADLTTSSMVNNARQFCVADGRVIWREASGGKNTYAAMDTPWSEKLAGNYTLAEFRDKRGFPPTEFSVYVINEKTVLEEGTSEYAVDNGDGTYSVTLHLNCVSPEAGNEEVNESSAVYYYVRQMLVTGGLTDYPVFKDVKITYTFDGSWRILSSEVSENYAAVMGISASCSSDSLTEYRYDRAEQAKAAVEKYYNGFFKQHMNTEVTPANGAVTSAMCLSNAFGSVLAEGAIFKVGVKIDELDINGVVSLDMVNGAVGDVRVKFGDVAAYYGVYDEKDTLYISLGGSKIKLNIEDLMSGSSESGILDGLDTDALLEQLGGGDFEINAEGTKATLSSTLDIFGLKITLLFSFDIDGKAVALDKLNATIPLGEKVIRATLAFGAEEDKPAALTDGERAQFVDVINDGFTVGGNAGLSVNGVNISLEINRLSLKINNGVSFKLDAQLRAADRIFDIFVAYDGGKVTAVYGDTENNLGVTLNIEDGDLQNLSKVFGDVLARIRSVIDEMVVEDKSAEEELTALESETEIAGGLASVLSEVINILGISTGEDGNIDVVGLINSIKITMADGKAVIAAGQNLALSVGVDQSALSFGLGVEIANATAAVNLNNLRLSAYADVDCPALEENLLTANDLAEILDYVASAAELLVEDEYSVSATASLFEDAGEGYEKTSDVNIVFEYIKGESFPVQVKFPAKSADGNNKSPISVTLRDDMYWHLAVNLVRDKNSDVSYDFTDDENGNEVKTLKDDLYIDIYILDAKPATKDGKTVLQPPEKDGGLDIYFIVSKYADAEAAAAVGAEFEPLKVYAPVNEVLTIIAAGAALLDVQGIDVSEQSNTLQSVIDTLGGLIDDVLIKSKLPFTHSQFSSLGASLLPQFLGKDLSAFLNDVLSSFSMNGGEEEGDSSHIISDGNFVNSVRLGVEEDANNPRLGDTKLLIALNSAVIYGGGFDDLTFSAYKANQIMTIAEGETDASAVAHSQITGAAVKNIYYGGNKRVDVGLNISREVEKLSGYGGFYNLSGIDTLLQALVNSATHGKASATDLDKAIYGDNLPDYLLNRYYLINGNVTANLSVAGIINVNVNIKVDASFTIDRNNVVTINARLEIPGVQELNQVAINGNTVTNITVKNGMVYIERTQYTWYERSGLITYTRTYDTPVVIARAIPIDDFGANTMDHIVFMFNLGPVVTDRLGDADGGGSNLDLSGDYGAAVGKLFAYFIENVDADGGVTGWTAAISRTGLTELVGMTMSDLQITFTADSSLNKVANGNAYIINGVSLNGSMQLVSGINLSFGGDLNYCNPQENMRNGTDGKPYKDITTDLSARWEQAFGCSSDKIAETELFNRLKGDENYVNITSDSATKMGEIKYVLDGRICGADGKELVGGASSGVYALYNAEGILSEIPKPHLQPKGGYRIEANINLSSLTYTESYVASVYSIGIESEHAIEGIEAALDYVYGVELDLSGYFGKITQDGNNRYKLVAFSLDGVEYNADKSVIPSDALAKICESEVTLIAVWRSVYAVTLDFGNLPEGAAQEALQYANANAGFTEGKLYYEEGSEEIPLIYLCNVTGYDFAGYTLDGASVTSIACLNGNVTLHADYRDVTLHLSLSSVDAFDYNGGNGTSFDVDIIRDSNGNYSIAAATIVACYDETNTKSNVKATFYSLLGWFYNGDMLFADKEGKIDGEVAVDFIGGERVTVEAAWLKMTVEGYGSRTEHMKKQMLWWVTDYWTFDIQGAFTYEVITGDGLDVTLFTVENGGHCAKGLKGDGGRSDTNEITSVVSESIVDNRYECSFDTSVVSHDNNKAWSVAAVYTVQFNGTSLGTFGGSGATVEGEWDTLPQVKPA